MDRYPLSIECDCGEEITLDDDWLPGDIYLCDVCGLAQELLCWPGEDL